MALDSAAKRQAVPGVGRPWMRGQFPAVGKGREWRSSAGMSYPVANFQSEVADIFTLAKHEGLRLNVGKLLK